MWLTRNQNGTLFIFENPFNSMAINENEIKLPFDIKYGDKPVEVELTIKKK